MWRVHKAAGRPFPRVSNDDVVDYLVMEAVCQRINKEDEEARKEAERDAWKKRHHEIRERVEH